MNKEDIDKKTICCQNCKWFETRTGFCRCNPPCAVPHYIQGIGEVINGVFPKVSLPALDWCGKFEKQQQLI